MVWKQEFCQKANFIFSILIQWLHISDIGHVLCLPIGSQGTDAVIAIDNNIGIFILNKKYFLSLSEIVIICHNRVWYSRNYQYISKYTYLTVPVRFFILQIGPIFISNEPLTENLFQLLKEVSGRSHQSLQFKNSQEYVILTLNALLLIPCWFLIAQRWCFFRLIYAWFLN